MKILVECPECKSNTIQKSGRGRLERANREERLAHVFQTKTARVCEICFGKDFAHTADLLLSLFFWRFTF